MYVAGAATRDFDIVLAKASAAVYKLGVITLRSVALVHKFAEVVSVKKRRTGVGK